MPNQIGVPSTYQPRSWVQTDRRTHEMWAALVLKHPRSAQLMHILCAHVGSHNAVVIGQKTLAKLMDCTDRTVRNALVPLLSGRWLQVVQVGAAATVNAYVINDRVAWTEARDQIGRLSTFSATVVADAEDQITVDAAPLLRLPIIYPPEEAMPHGEGEPGAQISLPGMEPVIIGRRD
ncbi:MAG: helix-turn-helix domain-containing protein [Desulfovibrionaceae bacterium]|nr:helix-turn-helix domain-containing protein [Desulfovibrionaceae bacterium]